MNNPEKITVSKMIVIYCRAKHKTKELCRDCRELELYAHNRLGNCKFGESKPACKNCPVHCYKKNMRASIQSVMRYSGPRMIFYHPVEAIRHMLQLKKKK